jgi:hypothetical protein
LCGLLSHFVHDAEPSSAAGEEHFKKAFLHMQAYGEHEYWEERYSSQSARFDWYMKYWALRPIITKFSNKQLPILHAGVGLSTFQVRSLGTKV